MSVYKPAGCNTYRYRFYDCGRYYQGSTEQLRKSDARLVEAQIKLRLRQEIAGLPPSEPSAPSVMARPRRRTVADRVYFIQAGERVKIGVAKNVRLRLSDLQIGNPANLILLGSVPGGRAAERQLHQHFAKYRVRGEWFDLTDDIRAFMQSRRGFAKFFPRAIPDQPTSDSSQKPKQSDEVRLGEQNSETAERTNNGVV